MAQVMVLAAGFGTRLRPLTDELPKALVPIGDRPLIAHVLGTLRDQGLDRAVVNIHHLAEAFHRLRRTLPLAVDLVHEPRILGTAGAVANARPWLGPAPVLIWNGDILAKPEVSTLFERAREGGLCLAIAPRPCSEGTVGVDQQGRVIRLRGECFGVEARGGDYLGIAALGDRGLGTLPVRGCLIGDWALPELRRGAAVTAVDVPEPWVDVGTLESYLKANLVWLEQSGLRYWCSEDAQIGSEVELIDTVVGQGARVSGHGRVERSVIWPHASARAPLAEAVVMASGQSVGRVRAERSRG